MRWPSCGESFWLDELHTAWTVDGDWADVEPRAAIGNQQTAYFDVLWWWRSITPASLLRVYGVEACLRLTSVLLTSVSAVIAYQVARQWSSGILAGVVAGLFMAVDSNSIFYGTELRPYAAIVFVSSLALGIVFRHDRPLRPTDRWCLHAIVLAGAWIHITSLTTLGWLVAVVMMGDLIATFRREQSRQWMIQSHLVPSLLWGVAGAVWFGQHSELWDARSNWQSFAMANSPVQVWRLWPWLPTVILPGLYWWSGSRQQSTEVMTLVLAIAGSTLTGYLVSKYGGVPVWHRRYYVAALPMIAILMGLLIGSSGNLALRRLFRADGAAKAWTPTLATCVVAMLCFAGLLWQQGTLSRIVTGDLRLIRRGENWRAAIAFIGEQRKGREPVWVDAALIEQQRFDARVDERRFEEYFRYPVGGPYLLNDAVGVGSDGLAAWLDEQQRTRQRQASYYLLRGRPDSSNQIPATIETHSFGRITVLLQRSGP